MIRVNGNIYRGPRPKSYDFLKRAGIKRVISLETGWYESTHNDSYEFDKPEDWGITKLRIPCSDIFPPDEAQVYLFLSEIVIASALKEPTLVHCLTGVDRTGFMIAVYRMRILGWPFNVAHAEFVSKGRHWWFWWWKYALKKWEIK